MQPNLFRESCIVLSTDTLTSESNPITQKRDDSGIFFIFDDQKAFLLCIEPRKTEEDNWLVPAFVCSDSGEIFTWALKVLPTGYQPKTYEDTEGARAWLVEVEVDYEST